MLIMWIARDKSGELCMYKEKPIIGDFGDFYCSMGDPYITLKEEEYPEITFENSPQEVVIYLKNGCIDKVLDELYETEPEDVQEWISDRFGL